LSSIIFEKRIFPSEKNKKAGINMQETKMQYLQFIQDIIARHNANSFKISGANPFEAALSILSSAAIKTYVPPQDDALQYIVDNIDKWIEYAIASR
jgi:hypothetical protein